MTRLMPQPIIFEFNPKGRRTDTVRAIAAPTAQKLALSIRINQLHLEIHVCQSNKNGARESNLFSQS